MSIPTEFEDRAAINELFSAYCFAMDDGDFPGVAALFTPHGTWSADYGSATGREDIAALLLRINPVKGEGPFRKHVVTNSLITLAGDTASSRASYLVIMDRGDGPVPIVVGSYLDRLARVEPGAPWLLAERRLVHELRVDDLALRGDAN